MTDNSTTKGKQINGDAVQNNKGNAVSINLALLVAHQDKPGKTGKRGAFIKMPNGKSNSKSLDNSLDDSLYEYDFSECIAIKLLNIFRKNPDFPNIRIGGYIYNNHITEAVKLLNESHEKKNPFDLAITVHFDSYPPKNRKNRVRVFYGVAEKTATIIACSINELLPHKHPTALVKNGATGYDNLEFIRETDMPALLIEAFNGKDPAIERLFADGLHSERAQAWMDNFVAGIAAGIKGYYNEKK